MKPSPDEIELFREAKLKFKSEEFSDDDEWKGLDEKTQATDFQIGDMVQVIKGDLNTLFGKIKYKEDNILTFVPDMDGLRDERFEVDQSFCVKHFRPSQCVKVVSGVHQGECGTVIQHEGTVVGISLDQTYREIKVNPRDLRLKSDQSMVSSFQSMLQRKK